MTFNLTLPPAVLSELTAKLSRLATDVSYRPGTPGQLSIDNFDPANEPVIVKLVASAIKIADIPLMDEPYIDYAELAREAARAKRLAATREHDAMARILAKRRRQEAVTVGL